MTDHTVDAQSDSPVGMRLGILCTAILGLSYMGFILMGAFAPGVMAQPVMSGGTMTVAMGIGFGVIGLGFVLTCIYAVIANAADTDPRDVSGKRGA